MPPAGIKAGLAALVLLAPTVVSQALRPREPSPKGPVSVADAHGVIPDDASLRHSRLLLKFTDVARVRTTLDGGLESLTGRDLHAIVSMAEKRGLTFRPGIRLPQQRLLDLERRAAERSGSEQPDLGGILEIRMEGVSAEDVVRLARDLKSLPIVEWVWLLREDMVPAGDIPPYTPDIGFLQTYKGANPGMGFEAAWEAGLSGAGVRLSDVEGAWMTTHEDLVDVEIHAEPGQTAHPTVFTQGADHHGAAVLGILAAAVNDYGCTGMVPDTRLYTYPIHTIEDGLRVLEAVTAAIADSAVGDVVLLELQTPQDGAPIEVELPIWTVVKLGTDAGVLVVAAAGNGSVNLDGFPWTFYKNWGDSGALIVGAGTATVAHDKLGFSTSGSRVNVQGWGEAAFTLGYGDTWLQYGGDENQAYEADFGGTSAASAMVAAGVVALQQHSRELYLESMSPLEMRQLLIDTGIPQGTGGHIGPFVDLGAALKAMQASWEDLGGALAGIAGTPVLDGAGKLEPLAAVAFTLSGVRPGSPCWLILGATAENMPFKGGILVPSVDVVVGPFSTDAKGKLTLTDTMPPDVVSGQAVYGQFWTLESASSLAASNALHGVVP
jgi:hypothetical protein